MTLNLIGIPERLYAQEIGRQLVQAGRLEDAARLFAADPPPRDAVEWLRLVPEDVEIRLLPDAVAA